LTKAKERDPNSFDRWIPATVTRRLKSYGIPAAKKSHGERRYRDVTLDTLFRIQRHYSIDLGIVDTHPGERHPSTPIATRDKAPT
jgi:hypothetical protein